MWDATAPSFIEFGISISVDSLCEAGLSLPASQWAATENPKHHAD